MGVTVANFMAVAVSKDSGKPCPVFPDTCITPAQPQPTPTPYPTGAAPGGTSPVGIKTPAGSPVLQQGAVFKMSTGTEAATKSGGLASSKTMGKLYFTMGGGGLFYEGDALFKTLGVPPTSNAAEGLVSAASQLRAKASALHSQLVNMPGGNATAWHAVLNEYIQTLSKLFILLSLK